MSHWISFTTTDDRSRVQILSTQVMVGFGVMSEGGELGPLVRTIIVDLEKELRP